MTTHYDSHNFSLNYSLQLPNTFGVSVETHSEGVVSIGQAIEALINAKRIANLRERYLTSLRQLLSQFARGRESQPLTSFTVETIEAWLGSRNDKLATRIGNIGRLSSLFAFAVRRGWITSNPCDRLERIRIEPTPPRILTPEQAERLMRWCQFQKPEMLGYLAKTLFAGIRPEEADRLPAEAIDEERGTILLDAAASKVRNRRIIHLTDTACAWLAEARRRGCLEPVSRATRVRWLREARAVLGFREWPQDILRHSAASYLMGLYRDAGRVAEQLGNSPSILLRHYREIVSPEDTERFWALAP